jgi:hypothetical protein
MPDELADNPGDFVAQPEGLIAVPSRFAAICVSLPHYAATAPQWRAVAIRRSPVAERKLAVGLGRVALRFCEYVHEGANGGDHAAEYREGRGQQGLRCAQGQCSHWFKSWLEGCE